MPTGENRRWCASVLLNRLMFIYFIQQKRFLDDDQNYLRNRLQMVRENYETDTAAESFFSTLEHERISRCRYTTRSQARLDIDTWYNKKRLHTTNNMTSPIDHENASQH